MNEPLTYLDQVDLYTGAIKEYSKFIRLFRETGDERHNQRAGEWVKVADSMRPIKKWEGPNN